MLKLEQSFVKNSINETYCEKNTGVIWWKIVYEKRKLI